MTKQQFITPVLGRHLCDKVSRSFTKRTEYVFVFELNIFSEMCYSAGLFTGSYSFVDLSEFFADRILFVFC